MIWLDRFAPARLTGTGASVFASFANRGDAEQILQQLPTGMQGFVAKGVNRSVAHTALSLQ